MIAREDAGDGAFVHDGDAVADAEDFLHVAGDDDDGEALVGEGAEESVDFGFGADVDAAGGFVDDEDFWAEGEPFGEDDFLLVAAGEVAGLGFGCGGFDAEGGDLLLGGLAFGGAVDEAGDGVAEEGGEGDVFADGHFGDEAGAAAVFGDEVDAVADGVLGAGDAERVVVEQDFALEHAVDAEEGLGDFGAAGADEAGEAEDFTGGDVEGDGVAGLGGGAEVFDCEAGGAGLGCALDVEVAEVATDHEADHVFVGDLLAREFAGVAAVAEGDDAVGDFTDFAEAVGDVDDADAFGAEIFDDGEEAGGFALGEGAGGFVEDEDAGALGEGFGDFDELLLGEGEGVERGVGVDVQAEAFEIGDAVAADGGAVDEGEVFAGFAAEEDVGADIEVVDVVEFLVDEADAEGDGIGYGVDGDGFVVDADFAGVGLVDAADNFHEGGLAGAVFTDEGDDFGGGDGEVDLVEGDDAGEAFGDVGQLQERVGHGDRVRRDVNTKSRRHEGTRRRREI